MSIATRLGNRRGQRHVGEQAEAGGACSSEHCSCWSHAELCPSILRGVHPWDPLARPSVHPWWSRGCCAPTPPADVTSAWEGPVATHRRLPRPSARPASFAHIHIPFSLLPLYGGSIEQSISKRLKYEISTHHPGSSQSVSIYRWEIEAKISVSVSISRFLRLRPLLLTAVDTSLPCALERW